MLPSCSCLFVWILIPVALGVFVYLYINTDTFVSRKLPDRVFRDGYYGLGDPKQDDTRIYPYQFKEVSEAEIQDLKERLNKTRFNEALEDSKTFEYGFNPEYLKKVVDHWSTKYDWRKQEKKIKSFDHFQTQIEGLNVHFIHIKPKTRAKKVVPVLLVNGWPSNFYEYIHVFEKFEQEQDGELAYELIFPSIPGYGFSEQPHKKGFNGVACSRVFAKLMSRLNYDKYYVHGSDWGSLITRFMAAMYPSRVLGYHTFTAFVEYNGPFFVRNFLSNWFPSLFLDDPDREKGWLFGFNTLKWILRETGYMHIQSTRPDTVATGLNDSPAGLAAYILEKYSVWTNERFLTSSDGALTRKYDLDDILTIVSIYWFNKNINYSQRFYKENFSDYGSTKATIRVVPTGYTHVGNGMLPMPKVFLKSSLGNIVYTNNLDDGGHFFALEDPKSFTQEVVRFIKTCERLPR